MKLGELIEIFQVEPEGEPINPQIIPAEEEPANAPGTPEHERSAPLAIPA